jgi:hypothetical protein
MDHHNQCTCHVGLHTGSETSHVIILCPAFNPMQRLACITRDDTHELLLMQKKQSPFHIDCHTKVMIGNKVHAMQVGQALYTQVLA